VQRRDLLPRHDPQHRPVNSLLPCVPRPLRLDVPALRQDQALRLGHCRQEIAVQCLLAIAGLFPIRRRARARVAPVPGSRCVHSNPARDGLSRLDPAALAVRVDHNRGLLSSVAARCPQARVLALERPGVRECCRRRFQRNCLRRQSRASHFTLASRPSANVPFWISASRRVSANCTRRGSVRARAEVPPLRLSRRRSRVHREK